MQYYCYPMGIVSYYRMLDNVYDRAAKLALCKWKLKDNYTYNLPDNSE